MKFGMRIKSLVARAMSAGAVGGFFTSDRKALETIEWAGIGVVLVIVAVAAYSVLGGSVSGWVNRVAGMI